MSVRRSWYFDSTKRSSNKALSKFKESYQQIVGIARSLSAACVSLCFVGANRMASSGLPAFRLELSGMFCRERNAVRPVAAVEKGGRDHIFTDSHLKY